MARFRTECNTCLGDILLEEMRFFNCGHCLCLTCTRAQHLCPLCRAPIRPPGGIKPYIAINAPPSFTSFSTLTNASEAHEREKERFRVQIQEMRVQIRGLREEVKEQQVKVKEREARAREQQAQIKDQQALIDDILRKNSMVDVRGPQVGSSRVAGSLLDVVNENRPPRSVSSSFFIIPDFAPIPATQARNANAPAGNANAAYGSGSGSGAFTYLAFIVCVFLLAFPLSVVVFAHELVGVWTRWWS
ncbi:hypothetical protein PLICRDRAFT_35182 [Plicaturopsis crispa FD-325 SS-3]|nr:hypothetical protein PLICRDRAFT_35182 [Plicaturopsis crispa FD-325 SS-3]